MSRPANQLPGTFPPPQGTAFPLPPLEPTLGVRGQLAEDEWQVFLRRRQELVDEILGRLQLREQLKGAGLDDDSAATLADALGNKAQIEEFRRSVFGPDINHLI